jgi:hypothetical protein
MAPSAEQRLIIITGPVGAGKSATGLALARLLRRPEAPVAVIDMDQVYGFVRQQDGYGEPSAWERARRGAAALANAWLAAGVTTVIVEGEFFSPGELGALAEVGPASIERLFFTLRLTYETALTRVQGDPLRGASKDPAFLKQLHAHFTQALPFLAAESLVIDTDHHTLDEVAARLAAIIEGRDHHA